MKLGRVLLIIGCIFCAVVLLKDVLGEKSTDVPLWVLLIGILANFITTPLAWIGIIIMIMGFIEIKKSRRERQTIRGIGAAIEDFSEFKGISKEEALNKWRANPNDKRTWGQIVGLWEKANKNE